MKHPMLETLSTIHTDGSRSFVHPADVQGRLTTLKKITAYILLVVYAALPWIPVNGYPAVFLDVQNRRFHFMGLTLATQDLWIGFFIITGLAFSLFYATALFGRLWCGWTCPYTVFLEHVYRRIERLIDGDATARRQLQDAPWTGLKIARRIIKHSLYLLLSAVIAHLLLSYFISLSKLYDMMQGPPSAHLLAFGIMIFMTVSLYFAFSWFREQFCIILCPYGRLQSALTDDHSIIIGYDEKRGEPRGKVGSTSGACIDCKRCVQVCPTGIDIRNGMQLECIGCGSCVDACDDIMMKLKRPPGLVRYDSFIGFHGGKTKIVRPRIVLYTFLLIVGLAVFFNSISRISSLNASAVRMVGAPFYRSGDILRNQFLIRVINKHNNPSSYKLEISGNIPPQLSVAGLVETLQLPALGEEQKTLMLSMPESAFTGPFKIQVKVTDEVHGDVVTTQFMEFLGPDLKLKSNAPLNAKDFIQ